MPATTLDPRSQNRLGAFVLAVADQLRHQTEQTVGHTGAAAAALVTIAHFPDRNLEFLRHAIGLSQPAAVRVVDRLVDEALVRRRRVGGGPDVALTMTAAGRRRARTILDVRQRVVAQSLPELSDAEAAVLARVVHRALEHLTQGPGTTCRMCDQGLCRHTDVDCPVVHRLVELGAPPPRPVPIAPDRAR
jgi:DNA-binding MarR family transcriptional regulator